MKPNKILQDYFGEFEGQLDRSGIVADRSSLKIQRQAGMIQAGAHTKLGEAPSGIRFKDGSHLHIFESAVVVNGKLNRTKYVYRFISKDGTFAFRYDKDDRSRGTDYIHAANGEIKWHPECHLHYLDEEEPRYKTHETNLAEILNFIKHCFIGK